MLNPTCTCLLNNNSLPFQNHPTQNIYFLHQDRNSQQEQRNKEKHLLPLLLPTYDPEPATVYGSAKSGNSVLQLQEYGMFQGNNKLIEDDTDDEFDEIKKLERHYMYMAHFIRDYVFIADLEVAFRIVFMLICDLKGTDLLTGSRGTDLYSITLQGLKQTPIQFVDGLENIVSSLVMASGLDVKVTTIRTDKGTKFLNKTLHAYLAKEGIRHETSTARTPEQNGVVERRNRTLVEAARTMLSDANVPLFSGLKHCKMHVLLQKKRLLVIPRHGKTTLHIINARKPSSKAFQCSDPRSTMSGHRYLNKTVFKSRSTKSRKNVPQVAVLDVTVTTSMSWNLLFSTDVQ
ncbi:integrase, catalytic region, zinc finger, CCHC-type containing protein [Tanacetum coccineum]